MFNTSATDMQLFRELSPKNRRAFSCSFTFRFAKSTAAHCHTFRICIGFDAAIWSRNTRSTKVS